MAKTGYIPLNKGKKTRVDMEVLRKFGDQTWFFSDTGYAKRTVRVKGLPRDSQNMGFYLHRLVLDAPKHLQVDHINGDKLDNRKINLRLCTNKENVHHSRVMKLNTSGYKGVSWMKSKKKWRARIKVDMKETHLGVFDSKEDAARAYNKAATRYFGRFAYLNQII